MAGFFGMEILLYFRIYMRGGGEQFVVSLQVLVWLLSTYDINSSVIDSDCILVLLSIKFLSEDWINTPKRGNSSDIFFMVLKSLTLSCSCLFYSSRNKNSVKCTLISTKILSSRVLIMVETWLIPWLYPLFWLYQFHINKNCNWATMINDWH